MQHSNSGYVLTFRQQARQRLVLSLSDAIDPNFHIQPESLPSTTYVHVIAWGQVPRLRIIIVISPLAIMLATIIIILASLYMARSSGADYIASFNTMDTLHIVAACSMSNLHTLSFPNYGGDIGLFSKDVRVEFSEVGAGSGAAGFHFSPK